MGVIVLADLKTYLTVEHTDDDALLSQIVGFVNSDVEAATKRKFNADTNDATERCDGDGEVLVLSHIPVKEITSITDTADDSVWDAEDYDLDAESGLVYRKDGLYWQCGRRRFTVSYKHGYAAVPDDIKTLAYLLGAMYYERRDFTQAKTRQGDTAQEFTEGWPQQAKDILKRYTVEFI